MERDLRFGYNREDSRLVLVYELTEGLQLTGLDLCGHSNLMSIRIYVYRTKK